MKRSGIFHLYSALLLGFYIAIPAQAAETGGALQGEYRFHGKTLVDPPLDEARETHLGLVIEGAAARDLYHRLKAPSVRDMCLDDGSLTRSKGPLRCTKLAVKEGWRCEFAIQLDTFEVVPDGTC
jgi:hypothetical protein